MTLPELAFHDANSSSQKDKNSLQRNLFDYTYRCSSCFLKYLGLVNFGIDEVRRDSDLRVTLTCDQHTHL